MIQVLGVGCPLDTHFGERDWTEMRIAYCQWAGRSMFPSTGISNPSQDSLHIRIFLKLRNILRQRLTFINLSMSLCQPQILLIILHPFQNPSKHLGGLRLDQTSRILWVCPRQHDLLPLLLPSNIILSSRGMISISSRSCTTISYF